MFSDNTSEDHATAGVVATAGVSSTDNATAGVPPGVPTTAFGGNLLKSSSEYSTAYDK